MHLNKKHTVSAIAAVDLANELIERDFVCLVGLSEISNSLITFYKNHQQGVSITENRVTEDIFLSLWKVASKQSRIPSLGIDIGKKVNINAKGILSNWLSCCETLKQALSVFQNNICLLNQSECWSVSYKEKYVKLTFEFSSEFCYPTMAIERSMVGLLTWAEFFSARKLNIKSASFIFDKPSYSRLYEAIFGPNISFNSDENCIELLTTELDLPLNGSNLYLRDLIAERSETINVDITSAFITKTKVQHLLRSDLIKYSKLEALLNSLHMSRTTLYRKLKEDKSVFSELVLKERINRLARINQSENDSEKIAEVLGFKDVSSYYKFLKRKSAIKLNK
jgi:AraC-like DNA-binding protein